MSVKLDNKPLVKTHLIDERARSCRYPHIKKAIKGMLKQQARLHDMLGHTISFTIE